MTITVKEPKYYETSTPVLRFEKQLKRTVTKYIPESNTAMRILLR